MYIASCQQITGAKTIPTFHMLVHSNILLTFQIRARNLLRTTTTTQGVKESVYDTIIFRVQPNYMHPR